MGGVSRLYNLIQDNETFFPVQYQDAETFSVFFLILLVWFVSILFGDFCFFTHFDFVLMCDFRGNHVTPYTPSIFQTAMYNDVKISNKLT